MNQTPLTNMEGRYITPATKEAFYALVAMGYEPFSEEYRKTMRYLEIRDIGYGLMLYQNFSLEDNPKQAYYHKGNFYDQPYEEFIITEEKVPFPELEDRSEWEPIIYNNSAMFEMSKQDFDSFYEWAICLDNERAWLYTQQIDTAKKEIFLKSIDRRLHKNRPLALAIGRHLITHDCIPCEEGDLFGVQGIGISNKPFKIGYGKDWLDSAIVTKDYIFPDQVIEWMHEYEKEEQNA